MPFKAYLTVLARALEKMPTFPPGYLKANKGGQLIGVSVAMGLFGILVVIARFLAQRRRKAPLGADDYVIIPALVCQCDVLSAGAC